MRLIEAWPLSGAMKAAMPPFLILLQQQPQMRPDRYSISSLAIMVPQLGRYADHHDLEISLFWDDRSDISFIGNRVGHYVDKLRAFPGLTDIDRRLIFKGSTTEKLNQIARLSDVLAGDIRFYFEINGERVWSRLDPSGLYGAFNPWRIIAGSPQVATIDEPLSVKDHVKMSATAVLQVDSGRFGQAVSHTVC